jgi:hypothetical protein
MAWIDPCREDCLWEKFGLQVKMFNEYLYRSYTRTVQNEAYYFRKGIAYTPIGSTFRARAYRRPAVMGKMGSSVFSPNIPQTLCSMNTGRAASVLQSLNPGVHFEVGDVNRLPVFAVESADKIYTMIEAAFGEHEATRETSIEFQRPGPSPWRHVQEWAQVSVDRPDGAPLPPYESESDSPDLQDFVSFAVGVALGRFSARGEGFLEEAPRSTLAAGTLFLSLERTDSLDHSACSLLDELWTDHGAAVGQGDDLRTYLRKSFFAYHKDLYENRPIYFPLSSAKKSFVAFVSIHRWKDDTLNVLLADHLVPTKRRLEGELEDLRTARATGSNKAKAEKRFTEVQKLLEELNDFIAKVTEIAEHGPPPPDDKTPRREVDARYAMDLDDGVMVNSAALWPLLEPQWKDPKKWWKELATAQGKKDYDWSHLAARYFPARVRTKCHDDPSLAVAHGCFWTLHPAKAYAWELRLQDEIRPDFTIDEADSDAARQTFLAEHTREADEIRAAELRRRERKAAKADDEGGAGPLFDADAEESADD